MTIYAWPTLGRATPADLDWSLQFNTVTFKSPLSGYTTTVEFPGARWRASFTLRNLQEADAAALQAFMVKLRGSSGRFYLHNFARPTPRGTIAGTPLVKGASQTGNSLLIDGCTVGTTLLAGDYFGVNDELKMVVTDATANGSGEMTLEFEPPLRSSPADNAAITTNRPTAVFRLLNDEAKWSTALPKLTDIPITCEEAWL